MKFFLRIGVAGMDYKMAYLYTVGQGSQMLDRIYGKCLSNLWQIFGKKILKMANFLAVRIFHYEKAIFWQY